MRNIPLHLEWCNTFVPAQGTREEVLEAWIKWGLSWGLIEVFYDKERSPVGYIFARPIALKTAIDPKIDYFKTLFYFDAQGDVAWIDTLWAPGHYPEVLKWLRATKRKYVGWQHNGKHYLKEIADLSGNRPIKSEIADALFTRSGLEAAGNC